jgi:hypothetical protein
VAYLREIESERMGFSGVVENSSLRVSADGVEESDATSTSSGHGESGRHGSRKRAILYINQLMANPPLDTLAAE